MYITYNKETKRVAYLGKKKPISYSDSLSLAEVENVPEKYDYLQVDNIQEKSRVIKEAYTEELVTLNEKTGEETTEYVQHPEITEVYFTCDLIPNFNEYTEEQLEAQKRVRYERLTTEYVRRKYSQDQMEAIVNNYLEYLTNPISENEKYLTEYTEMQSYRAECKVEAKTTVYDK